MVKNLHYIIFDVDGVLFDSKKFYRGLLGKITQLLGRFNVSDKGVSSLLVSLGNDPLFLGQCSLRPSFGLQLGKRILDRLIIEIIEMSDFKYPKVFPGVKNILDALRGRKKELFISTASRTGNIMKWLDKEDLTGFFAKILGSDIASKQDHIPFLAKSLKMNLEDFVRQACCVGDTPIDMILAKRYGVQAVGIANTVKPKTLLEAGADVVIENIEDLISVHKKKSPSHN